MTVALTEKRKQTIINACVEISNTRTPLIRNVARLIGLLVASFPAVAHGLLYYRNLERDKTQALKHSKGQWERPMVLSKEALVEIQWLEKHIPYAESPINIPNPDLIIKTDASMTAWGAVCEESCTGGPWFEQEARAMHINELEMLAVFMGLQTFAKDKNNSHIKIFTDNTSTMLCLNKMGSSKSPKLNKLCKCIWEWCISKNIWLSLARIAGRENVEADFQSRHINLDTEWKLDSDILFSALSLLQFYPIIDLFASRLNHQFENYMSLKPDPGATGIDAFSINWVDKYFYAFPPFCLLPRVLQKIKIEMATGVVIAPYWPAQPFFPLLMKLIIVRPILLSARKTLLQLPSHPGIPHPLHKKIRLFVCLVSRKGYKHKAFLNRQPTSCWRHGDQTPQKYMLHTLQNGKGTHLQSKWIQFHHL